MTSLARTTLRALCLGAAVAACLLLGMPVDAQDRRGSAELSRIDVEGTYYRQPQLLERALARLQPSRAGQPQLFFVGFAGYGPQAVFKREVLAVRDLFDAQFSTKGRSLVLINHASTMADTALANVSNLERALRHIGGLMSKDDDVLFLFLTSHGHKGLFAVEMPGFGLNDLTPDVLREVLDSSGIKNRVVVVSACHSGSFVEGVAEPNTLVITASHADRNSFGCDDRREWTYFGDAFFNRALREERSFERAFQRATQLVSDWENRDKFTPSLPQIAGGEALRPKLAALADRGKE
jgi:Peptidase C13 family